MNRIYRLLCALLLISMFSLSVSADTTSPRVFNIGNGLEVNSPLYKQFKMIYTVLFQRLGIPMQFIKLPLERCLIETNKGKMDADAGRVYSLNDLNIYPNLIRVEEPVFELKFAVFSTDPALQVINWESLKKVTGNIAYQRGTKIAEKKLPLVVNASRLIVNNDYEDNCRMLVAGRISAFIGVYSEVSYIIKNNDEWRSKIRQSGVVETSKIYPYFNVKHKNLIPKVEKILKEMKADGTYARLLELNGQKN